MQTLFFSVIMSTDILYIIFLTVVPDGEFGRQGAGNMNSFKSSFKEEIVEGYLLLFSPSPKSDLFMEKQTHQCSTVDCITT